MKKLLLIALLIVGCEGDSTETSKSLWAGSQTKTSTTTDTIESDCVEFIALVSVAECSREFG